MLELKGAGRNSVRLFNAARGLPYALKVQSILATCDILSCHFLHSFLFSFTKKAGAVTHTLHRDPKRFLFLYAHLDRIYTGSEAVSSQARLVAPLLAEKVRTIYNCVDFRGYEPSFPAPNPTLRFIFVGRFSGDKGVDVLIHAFAAAVQKEPQIHLSLVGPLESKDGADEDLVERCRSYIRNQNLSPHIEILPPVFDRKLLDRQILESDVVCLPSVRGETLNMSIIESMRLGKCLLISDLPANAPLVKPGFNGFFAKAGDEADWTRQILHLASTRHEIAQLGANSFQYGLETFSVDRIAREYVADFQELVQKSRRRQPAP